jgi:hypothetical protein
MSTIVGRGDAVVGRLWIRARWAGVTLSASSDGLALQAPLFGDVILLPEQVVSLVGRVKWWNLTKTVVIRHNSRTAPPVVHFCSSEAPQEIIRRIEAAGFSPRGSDDEWTR